jgi:adenylate kinase family enzyme
VIDGNYNSTVQVRLEAADTVVFMDLPTHVCLWGILSRQLRHGRGQNDQNGVYNRITGNVLRYVLGYRRKMRARVMAKIGQHASHARVIMLTSRHQTRDFLRHVASSAALSDLSPP